MDKGNKISVISFVSYPKIAVHPQKMGKDGSVKKLEKRATTVNENRKRTFGVNQWKNENQRKSSVNLFWKNH